jgi:hypothetical protein
MPDGAFDPTQPEGATWPPWTKPPGTTAALAPETGAATATAAIAADSLRGRLEMERRRARTDLIVLATSFAGV